MIPHRVKHRAVTLGRRVHAGLRRQPLGHVIGVTRRGVFVQIEPRVIYLTADQFRGPLTINLDRALVSANGETVRLTPTRLIFPAFEVDLSTAAVWRPAVQATARPIADQRESLRQLATSVLTHQSPRVIPSATKNLQPKQAPQPVEIELPRRRSTAPRNDMYPIENGCGALLPHLLDLPEKQALSAGEAALLAQLTQLREALSHDKFDRAATLLEGLLGLGRGLTPSGDDVIIGLLLMLAHNRMNLFADGSDARKRFVGLAYERTTTISANLIECAADGEADERLITVVTGLVTGRPSIEDCAKCVLGWGSSSGVDALTGMAVAL